ncbi:unnamed protein product [Ectocarpus sp. 12 AP-2014]
MPEATTTRKSRTATSVTGAAAGWRRTGDCTSTSTNRTAWGTGDPAEAGRVRSSSSSFDRTLITCSSALTRSAKTSSTHSSSSSSGRKGLADRRRLPGYRSMTVASPGVAAAPALAWGWTWALVGTWGAS